MKKLLTLLLLLFVSFLSIFAEDTGKYRLLSYYVTLTPYSDGKVKMEYYQKWQVTEGHIPWITVGLPNDDYKIISSGLAVKTIADAEQSGWSGVRIDLDKDYQPGESFEIAFTIDENKLFYEKDSVYHLEFTPGWYDQAFIDDMKIQINCFFKVDKVKTSPTPLIIKDGNITWIKTKLGKGEKFEIKLSFPKKLFPKEISEDNLKDDLSTGAILIILLILGAIIVGAVLIVILSDGGGDYSGGSIFFGGSSGSGGLSSSGGGGFGGVSSSCACACVSCACACACAGGGGAGCSRKTRHQCPKCNPKKK